MRKKIIIYLFYYYYFFCFVLFYLFGLIILIITLFFFLLLQLLFLFYVSHSSLIKKNKKKKKRKNREKGKGKEKGNVKPLFCQTQACYAIMVLYWERSVAWSWWLKEQEATSALSLVPNFKIGRCRGLHNKNGKIHERRGLFLGLLQRGIGHWKSMRERRSQIGKRKQSC